MSKDLVDRTRGAHCTVDLRWNGRDFFAGEPFPLDDLNDEEIGMMHSAKRIAFGAPSKTLQLMFETALEERGEERAATQRQREEERLNEEIRLEEEAKAKLEAARAAKAEAKGKADAKARAAAKAARGVRRPEPQDADDVPTSSSTPA